MLVRPGSAAASAAGAAARRIEQTGEAADRVVAASPGA
jgi:hypothetical protein